MRKYLLPIFYQWIVQPWLRFIIGVRFKNRETFDGLDQFIIVANHNSHFDTVSILAALPDIHLLDTHPVAAGDYFGSSPIKAWLTTSLINTILINRNRKGEGLSTIDVLDGELKKGKSLILFPEGTRGKPGILENFKSGIAVLLKKNPDVPFIPVYLDGFGRVLPKDSNLIIPLNCMVRFGSPLTLDENTSIEENLEIIKQEILKLKDLDERDKNQFTYN